ncbi:MAG: hypothetical protein IJB10_00670 [Clostridia bacterium]|nr:hypothetical protein [Clostridia bacterium]
MQVFLTFLLAFFVLFLTIYFELTFPTFLDIRKINKKDKISVNVFNNLDDEIKIEYKGLTLEKALHLKKDFEKNGMVVYLTILTQNIDENKKTTSSNSEELEKVYEGN